MREHIIQKVSEELADEGFAQLRCVGMHSCFDIAARRGFLLLVKILENIDALGREEARDLRNIAAMLMGSSFLVGERAKELVLEDGVVYERYEIPAGNLDTFKMIIEEDFPKVKKYRKFLVEIDGEKMARMRNERGLSLEELARISKISKETLYRYEHGKTKASEEHVKIIESVFHAEMRRAVSPFVRSPAVHERTVLSKLGFESVRARSAPFDLVAKEEAEKVVAGEQADRRTLAKRAGVYQKISDVLQSHSCFILSESKRDEIMGVPVVRKNELAELRKARELIKLIKERSA